MSGQLIKVFKGRSTPATIPVDILVTLVIRDFKFGLWMKKGFEKGSSYETGEVAYIPAALISIHFHLLKSVSQFFNSKYMLKYRH